jgi:acyl dehydratase
MFPVSTGDRAQIHFEDLVVGRVYRTASIAVTAEEIATFAARYDPQPFHLDPAAGERSVFGGVVASGWLTAALTMRLMVQGEFHFGSGVVGLGVDTLQWPRPVRAGETLTASVEVTALRTSESKPGFGVAKLRTTTTNQRSEVVQVMVSNVLVPRRAHAPAKPAAT